MIEWDSSRGCKYFSISTNQSMWYTSSTKCRIKTVYDHLNRCRKVFDKIHHSFMIKISRKWAFREHQSVQFSHSVVLDSLRPHDSQHARPPCPSPTPGVHSDSRPSSQWCHPAILSSVVPFSSCPQSPPSIRDFSNESRLRMRWPKYWSFSFSIIPSKEIPGLIFRMD